MVIKRWDFSDPQSGKGPCDRVAAVVKRKVRLFVDENNKCTNGEEFLACASSYGEIKATTMIYGSVELLQQKTKATIPGINLYNNFQFEDDNIFAWRAYKIGTGVPMRNDQWTHKHDNF